MQIIKLGMNNKISPIKGRKLIKVSKNLNGNATKKVYNKYPK
jgi:hypothetical protein